MSENRITFYGYDKCSTCRKAKATLKKQGINFKDIDITTAPPTHQILATLLKNSGYKITDLFNKSGEQYRLLGMKDKIKILSEAEMLTQLAGNGRLIKRPIVTDGKRSTVGFDENVFAKIWK